MSSSLGSAIVSWFTPSKRKRGKENVDPLPNGCPPPPTKKLCSQERLHLGLSCKRELFPPDQTTTAFTTKTTKLESRSFKMAASNDIIKAAQQQPDHVSLLSSLPLEMVHTVFRYLDTESLGVLATLSKDLNATVLNYLESRQGLKQVLPRHFGAPKIRTPQPEIFGEAGKLSLMAPSLPPSLQIGRAHV